MKVTIRYHNERWLYFEFPNFGVVFRGGFSSYCGIPAHRDACSSCHFGSARAVDPTGCQLLEEFEPLLWLLDGVRSYEEIKIEAYHESRLIDLRTVRADNLVLRIIPLILGRSECHAARFFSPELIYEDDVCVGEQEAFLESNWLYRLLVGRMSAMDSRTGMRCSLAVLLAEQEDGFSRLLNLFNSLPFATDAFANAFATIISLLDVFASSEEQIIHNMQLLDFFPDDGLCQQ